MDRVFLDANILFSIAYGSRSLGNLQEMARQGRCKLLASAYVVKEAMRNLSSREQITRLNELVADLEIVPEVDPEMPCPIFLPEKDRPVFQAAVQSHATCLITGDLEHFGAYRGKTTSGVLICTPRDYFNRD